MLEIAIALDWGLDSTVGEGVHVTKVQFQPIPTKVQFQPKVINDFHDDKPVYHHEGDKGLHVKLQSYYSLVINPLDWIRKSVCHGSASMWTQWTPVACLIITLLSHHEDVPLSL